jgi:hypothetical protein
MNPADEEEKLNAVGECFEMNSQKLLKLWQEMYVLSQRMEAVTCLLRDMVVNI